MPIRDELVTAGWTFKAIHWDNERDHDLAKNCGSFEFNPLNF